MTTQTTTIRPSRNGVRALIGAAAATLAVLGGALLWQVRPTSEIAVPVTTIPSVTSSAGVAPLGGLAELYYEEQQAQAARAAAQVTTRGGMAELYAEQGMPVVRTAPVTTLGGMAELYGEQQAAARATVAQLERMGGMAELYRDQAATGSSAR